MFDWNPYQRFSIRTICIALLITSGIVYSTFAQTTAPASPPIGPLKDGWEDIDQRFVFLTVELSSVEASLKAVNNALVAAGREQAKAQQRAENYGAGNSRMDRQGGGPMDWQDFYGKTAKSFYYHSSGSIDVRRQSNYSSFYAQGQSNVQINGQYQGEDTTAIARPPQFDYIYRANTDAQQHAQADAASLGSQIDKLLARRRELESEQSSLWCKIALRGLSSRNLTYRPLYRYDLSPSPNDEISKSHFAAIAAGCKFMRIVNLLVKQAQPALDGDQGPVYAQMQHALDAARDDLSLTLLNFPKLADTLSDPASDLGQFNAASKRLDDLSQNLIDAQRLALDGDRAGDDQRKDGFRGQFQQTAMDFADTVVTADNALTAAASQWAITPDTSHVVAADSKVLIVPEELRTPPNSPNAGSSADPSPKSSAPPSVVQPNYQPDVKAIAAERDRLNAVETRPLRGTLYDSDVELTGVGKPYAIEGVYQPAKISGEKLQITVDSGVEIRGGTIDLKSPDDRHKNSELILNGSRSRPIVLRNVQIDQPLGGAFTASYVIFDHCTFSKIGGWFAYYSSKWEMDHCLLYRCNFPSFKAVDYGFKLTDCTFVGMKFPEIEHKNDQEKTFDYMDRLRKDWNTLKSCSFVDCTVPPTVFWCSENSNFWSCTFLPGPTFRSDHPTRVAAFVDGTTGESPEQIAQDNLPERAALTIWLRNAPFPVSQWAADCPIPELRLDERFATVVLDSTDARR